MTLDYLLYGLATEQVPLASPAVSKLSDVLHHAVFRDIAPVHSIVASLQSTDDAGNIDLLNQFAIPPVLIETILERSANLHSLLSLLV
jgi:hypothetical protein